MDVCDDLVAFSDLLFNLPIFVVQHPRPVVQISPKLCKLWEFGKVIVQARITISDTLHHIRSSKSFACSFLPCQSNQEIAKPGLD
jgi:hypothetical protein